MISHAQRLAGVNESVRVITRNILTTWQQATEDDRASGERWYATAGLIVDQLAILSGRSREHVAAVVAHLSPRTQWSRNVAGAESLLTGGIAPGCMGGNVERARLALASDTPLATLNGPKTARFAANMLGNLRPVTVDVWAARVAMPGQSEPEQIIGRAGVYAAVEHCYQLAAARMDVAPAVMQATTWVVKRNGRAD